MWCQTSWQRDSSQRSSSASVIQTQCTRYIEQRATVDAGGKPSGLPATKCAANGHYHMQHKSKLQSQQGQGGGYEASSAHSADGQGARGQATGVAYAFRAVLPRNPRASEPQPLHLSGGAL